MAKRRRKKVRKTNGRKNKPRKPVEIDSSKRNFLKVAGGVLVAAPIIYFGSGLFSNDRWDFLEEIGDYQGNYHLKPMDHNEVVKRYTPIGPKMNIMEKGALYEKFEELKKEVEKELISEIKRRGFKGGGYNVDGSLQDFGVPARLDLEEQAISYSKKAIEFMRERISGLDDVPIKWTPLKGGSDFSEDFNGRCFIGHSYYTVQRINVQKKGSPEKSFSKGRAIHESGAFNNTRINFINRNLYYFSIFIPIGSKAVSVPFSEGLPLTTFKAGIDYRVKYGIRKAIQADETICEGLSYHLSLGIIDELGIPIESVQIKKFLERMSKMPNYEYVPNSVKWIAKNGMQNAFDLYMESPEKYLEAIKS